MSPSTNLSPKHKYRNLRLPRIIICLVIVLLCVPLGLEGHHWPSPNVGHGSQVAKLTQEFNKQ